MHKHKTVEFNMKFYINKPYLIKWLLNIKLKINKKLKKLKYFIIFFI